MTDIPAADGEPPKLPRWAQIIAGLFLLPIALLCLAGSVVLVLAPPDKVPLLTKALGVVFGLICLWVFWLAVRLLANRPGRGFFGPLALKVSALIFFALPLVGIFTGYWREKPLLAALQTLCYLAVATALWRLANSRKQAV